MAALIMQTYRDNKQSVRTVFWEITAERLINYFCHSSLTTMLIVEIHLETGGQDKIPQLKTTPAAFVKEIPFRKHI